MKRRVRVLFGLLLLASCQPPQFPEDRKFHVFMSPDSSILVRVNRETGETWIWGPRGTDGKWMLLPEPGK